MPEPDVVAVIMAGGAGTRFWPSSTPERPKQFLALLGERTLLQQSFDRLRGLVAADRVLVLTAADYVPLVRAQLPEVPAANVVGEPCRRDTAAAACLGALLARRRADDPVVVTVTADHLIEPTELFGRTVESAVRAARDSGALYTFGIPPSHPATGYGYLEIGEATGVDDGIEHLRVRRFVEKPDVGTAAGYLASGRYLWNSGMFVWTAGSVLAEFRRQLPAHPEALAPAVDGEGGAGWPASLAAPFERLERISVDYGIMEGAADVRCVRAPFAWSDVGGWTAVAERLPADDAGNRVRARLVADDASRNLVFADDPDETVVLLGVDGLAVVRSGPRTLVVPLERADEIKRLVERLGT